MTKINYQYWIDRCHGQARDMGWWDKDRDDADTIALILSEIFEGFEGWRKNEKDNHLPHRDMLEVELADAAIRIFDFCGKIGIELHDFNDPAAFDSEDFTFAVPMGYFVLLNARIISSLMNDPLEREYDSFLSSKLSSVLYFVFEMAKAKDYDLETTMDEKLKYNLTRADHQRGNQPKI